MSQSDENWTEYRKLILSTLERIENNLDAKVDEINDMKSDIKLLKQELGGKVGQTDFQVMRAKLSFWLTIGMIIVTGLINGVIKTFFE